MTLRLAKVFMTDFVDNDPQETQEWLDALESIIEVEGDEKAHHILEKLIDLARRSGVNLPYSSNTAYVNTIPVDQQERITGNQDIEHKLRSYIRWNAMTMVVKANLKPGAVGGHIASFASSATLYDVGFNHFFKGDNHVNGADMVFFQGHIAPGIYARSFLEGRLTEDQLDNFRFESDGKGLSSYPHPWLMPDYWQFPTVSMGLGPILAIYQARFMKYMEHRGMAATEGRNVWAYLGDGEMDEPESLGAITLAGREKLDNLNFVINCNLQRLDGPVRGNGKIIQELEAIFRGAGWNVLKVIWGSEWDQLLAKDKNGLLQKITRTFIVLASGESGLPAMTATPSGTATPSPTPTSTTSGRTSMPSTTSGIPSSGYLTPTFIVFIMGFSLIFLGLFVKKLFHF